MSLKVMLSKKLLRMQVRARALRNPTHDEHNRPLDENAFPNLKEYASFLEGCGQGGGIHRGYDGVGAR
jgi:hypothetical protein